MALQEAVAPIDAEIARLEAVMSEAGGRINELRGIRAVLAGELSQGAVVPAAVGSSGARSVQSRAPRRRATTTMAAKGPGRRPGGRMTEEGRKKLSEAMKKRWAQRKKAGQNVL